MEGGMRGRQRGRMEEGERRREGIAVSQCWQQHLEVRKGEGRRGREKREDDTRKVWSSSNVTPLQEYLVSLEHHLLGLALHIEQSTRSKNSAG